MAKINWGRVLLGGLLAGAVLFALELIYDAVSTGQLEVARKALGQILAYVLTFGVGLAAVWLYAAARSRFGPGPKTAALMGFAYWVIGYVLPSLAWGSMAQVPTRTLVLTLLWTLPEIVIATVVGAWVYQE